MTLTNPLTDEERGDIEDLISSFDNHGCGMGLDIKAQIVLRLLDALDQAEEIIASHNTSQGRPLNVTPFPLIVTTHLFCPLSI